MLDLPELKKNHKTQYLADQYEALLRQETETSALLSEDSTLGALVEDELKNIRIQKEGLEAQIETARRI